MPILLCEGPCSGDAIKRADDIIKRGQQQACANADAIVRAYNRVVYTDHESTSDSVNVFRCVDCNTTRRFGRGW